MIRFVIVKEKKWDKHKIETIQNVIVNYGTTTNLVENDNTEVYNKFINARMIEGFNARIK